jgi:hypothetical protein
MREALLHVLGGKTLNDLVVKPLHDLGRGTSGGDDRIELL